MWEGALRQSLLMSKGRFSVFVTRPISGVIILFCFLLLISPAFSMFRRRQEVLKGLEKEE